MPCFPGLPCDRFLRTETLSGVDAPAEHAGAAASVDVAGGPAMRYMIKYTESTQSVVNPFVSREFQKVFETSARKARRASSIRS